MKTIAVISQKGGAGKTTATINLAGAAIADGLDTAIIDLDPQASAAGWADKREEPSPAVVSAQASRLPSILEAARGNKADLVLIDTAPHSESSALAAARAADLVIIPCRPAILDLRAIHSTIDLAKLAGTPALVVFNAAPYRGSLADEAAAAIETTGVSIAPCKFSHRAAFVHSLTASKTVMEYEPKGKAAYEAKQLYKWISKHVKELTSKNENSLAS